MTTVWMYLSGYSTGMDGARLVLECVRYGLHRGARYQSPRRGLGIKSETVGAILISIPVLCLEHSVFEEGCGI